MKCSLLRSPPPMSAFAVQSAHRQSLGRLVRRFRAQAQTASTGRRFYRQVSHKARFDNAAEWVDVLRTRYSRHARLMDMPQMLADPETAQVEETVEGFDVIRQMKLDIAALPKQPTDFQLSLIWFVIELMAPRIFGQAWTTDRVRIKKQMGWVYDHDGIGGVLTGRKEGKSTGLAMACVIVLLNLRAVPVALFSRTKEQSCIILGMAKELLAGHPRVNQFKMSTSSQTITLQASDADKRIMKAWTGTADVRAGGRERGACLFLFTQVCRAAVSCRNRCACCALRSSSAICARASRCRCVSSFVLCNSTAASRKSSGCGNTCATDTWPAMARNAALSYRLGGKPNRWLT